MDNLSDYEISQIIEKWQKLKLLDQIINPITNRKIKKNGKTYKKIDKVYEQLIDNKLKKLKMENYNNTFKEKDNDYLLYESLNLDINNKYIIDKIKIADINNLSIILNFNNSFSLNRFNFDINQENYNYDIIKFNKLIVGIKDTEIEEVYPINDDTKYISFIQYQKNINIINKTLDDTKPIFCLLCVEKPKIEAHDDKEIALFLLTLQYWNYLLESYKVYGWVNNLLAIVKVNSECYLYSIKIDKKYIEKYINECKTFKYNFEINIDKCYLDMNKQLELIKYLGFGVFDIFNKI